MSCSYYKVSVPRMIVGRQSVLVGLSHEEEERRWSPDDVKRHSRGDPNNKPEVVLVPRRPRQHRCKHKFTSCIAVN